MTHVVYIKSTGQVGTIADFNPDAKRYEVDTKHGDPVVEAYDLRILFVVGAPGIGAGAKLTRLATGHLLTTVDGVQFDLTEFCTIAFNLTTYIVRSEERERINLWLNVNVDAPALTTAENMLTVTGSISADKIIVGSIQLPNIRSTPVRADQALTAQKIPLEKPTSIGMTDARIAEDRRTTVETYDNGSSVRVDGYAGGSHRLGAWGSIDLSFIAPDGAEMPRRYYAADVIGKAATAFAELGELYDGGKMNVVEIGNELADAQFVYENVSKVYSEVTGGVLSKATHHADTVIQYANDERSAHATEYAHDSLHAWLNAAHETGEPVAVVAARDWSSISDGKPPYQSFVTLDCNPAFKIDLEKRHIELNEEYSISDAVGHGWEAIDQLLTKRDGSPGGWLIEVATDQWEWTGQRIAAVAAMTQGLRTHPVNGGQAHTNLSTVLTVTRGCVDDLQPVVINGSDRKG